MKFKKIFIFLLLTVFFCSFNTNQVSAETEKENVKEEVRQTQPLPLKPEIYLNQDADNDGHITTIKKEMEISGYIINCKQNGITEVYFNNEPVLLQEDGSFSKTIKISFFESNNYNIVIKDGGGNIIDCRALSILFSPSVSLFCFLTAILGLELVRIGFKKNLYGGGEGTKDIVFGIIIFVVVFSIIPIMYFSPVS